MNPVGIGMLGCGEIARRRYFPLFAAQADAKLVAVCARRPEHAREAATRLGGSVEAVPDLRALLAHPGVEAVIVCTPHRLHAQQAAQVLDAGKHVLVEKPMATSWADAQHLARAAGKARGVAMILPFEHVAELRAMQSCLSPELAGRIVSIQADFSGPGAPAGRGWKYSLAEAGGGVIVAHAVYALDLIASIMGPALKVSAFANTLEARRRAPDGGQVDSDIEDNAVLLLEYASGQVATVRSCWSYPHKQRNLVIQGTRRAVVMAGGGVWVAPPVAGAAQAGGARSALFPGQEASRVPLPGDDGNIVTHFLRAVRAGRHPESNLEQALHVTEQMMLAMESARTGQAQMLTTTFRPRHALDPKLF